MIRGRGRAEEREQLLQESRHKVSRPPVMEGESKLTGCTPKHVVILVKSGRVSFFRR